MSALSPDLTVFIGDALDYCAFPNECVKGVEDISDVKLLGNHEACVLEKITDENFNPVARESLKWTRGVLSKPNMKIISSWDLTYSGVFGFWNTFFAHCTYSSPDSWNYLFGLKEAKTEMKKIGSDGVDLVFIGHTHFPAVYITDKDENTNSTDLNLHPEIDLERGMRYIFNVGSSGQPRDGNYMPSYVVFDTLKNLVVYKRFDYDVESAYKEILKSGLPKNLASRIILGT